MVEASPLQAAVAAGAGMTSSLAAARASVLKVDPIAKARLRLSAIQSGEQRERDERKNRFPRLAPGTVASPDIQSYRQIKMKVIADDQPSRDGSRPIILQRVEPGREWEKFTVRRDRVIIA